MARIRATQSADDVTAINALLARHSPEVVALASELRAVVREAAPSAREAARAGWHALAYSDALVGYFCGIFPRAAWVDLVVEWGVLLDDPENLFTARRSQVGTVRLWPGEPWERDALLRLLRAALSLPAERAVRVAMARERRP